MSIKELFSRLSHEEKIEFLKENQKRISNDFKLTEETKRLIEAEGEMIDPDTYYDENEDGIIDWKDFEANLDKNSSTLKFPKKLNKKHGIEWETNLVNFPDNKLVITKEQFPNLKTLYACGLGLEAVELDHDGLENLYLVNNNLTELDLSKTPNLVNLVLTNNKITEIDVSFLKKLEDFRINGNSLTWLDVGDCVNLWSLDCSGNYRGSRGNLTLKLEGANDLEILDCAENWINGREFPYLPNLLMISIRACFFPRGKARITIIDDDNEVSLNSPKLKFLDYHNSDIKSVKHNLELENPKQLRVCNAESYTNPDGSYNPDVATEWEAIFNKLYLSRQAKKQGITPQHINKSKKNNRNFPITDPDSLTTDYPEFWEKNKDEEYLDFSHEKITGTMIIKDFLNLKSLNIGNNFLSYLVVRNCPQLTTLRYAHNKLKHDAFIDWASCPNLKTINKENYHGGIVWDQLGEEKFHKGELKGQERFNQKGETELTQADQALGQLMWLLAEAEVAAEQNNRSELTRYLAEIKTYTQLPEYDKLKARINKLEQKLSESQTITESQPTKLIVGGGVITCLVLGSLIWVTSYWVKAISQACLLRKKKT